MFAAIYYPHTAIRDENFLKHAMLYWDEIEYISLPTASTSFQGIRKPSFKN